MVPLNRDAADIVGTEIERKFLVSGDGWRKAAEGTDLQQGYLTVDPNRSVRVRRAGERAWLTIKGATKGISRQEFEYEIPSADAEALLKICLPGVISKTRYKLVIGNHCWEIDEFYDDNADLIMAEIELAHQDEDFDRPDWLGPEVSDDARYYNASLSEKPYRLWKHQARDASGE